MKINIIAVGKLKKDFIPIYKSFLKRIEFYSKVNLIEIKESNKSKESLLILKAIPKNSRAILLSLQGKSLSSEDFAKTINEDNITFIIGGSDGVDESMFKEKIKFSKMTFNHHLFRLMLIEQIYRAIAINNNLKYHK
ncbi:MAG: 23S rRNA (pseudouridine(1915)-N(3))-methyltransferase RlmH [Tenericutes bacterium]|nr:MAG: 23S rRNA (pseudouridine(1915)-N(3))-methyltransferase RlmH [Mycoplasmatota bacterium]